MTALQQLHAAVQALVEEAEDTLTPDPTRETIMVTATKLRRIRADWRLLNKNVLASIEGLLDLVCKSCDHEGSEIELHYRCRICGEYQ